MDRVIWESRHKFVYYDNESIDELKRVSNQYCAKLNSEEPIVVYIKDEGLPEPNDMTILDRDIVKSFHSSYYQLLIFLSIIEGIISSLDNDDLNKKLVRLFKVVSYCGTSKIDDVDTLIKMLRDSIKKYRDVYIQYITTGSYESFYNDLPIQFIMIDNLLPLFKESIGLKKYFCLMMEFDGDVSKYNSMAINDYIASRCNGYLSMNVLLPSDNCWKCYYANNSQYIEWCHDYTDVDLRNSKKRIRQN